MFKGMQLIEAEPSFTLNLGSDSKDLLLCMRGALGRLMSFKARSKDHLECFVTKQIPGPHS